MTGRHGVRFLMGVAAAAGMLCAPALGQVSGRISRVGLAGGGTQIVRDGTWTLLEVELSYAGSSPLSGTLEVQQTDRDGDITRFQRSIALAPGAPPRPFGVYFVPNLRGGMDTVGVRLIDDRGRLVPILDEHGAPHDRLMSKPVLTLGTEETLILDLSDEPIKLLSYVPDPTREGPTGVPLQERWRVIRLSAENVPDRWYGVEVADVIVWDDPDVGRLTPAQLDALVDWIRHGGRLVLSASRHWQSLGESRLGDLLPVRLTGTERVDEVQEFSQKILNDATHDFGAYYRVNPVTRCLMTPLPGSVPVPSDPAVLQGLEPLVYRRLAGRGATTIVGASFRELLAPAPLPKPASAAAPDSNEPDPQQAVRDRASQTRRVLFETILGLPYGRRNLEDAFERVDAYQHVRETIGFQTASVLYLVSALVFAGAYTFCATMGSYWYLRRRALLHHTWSAFTLIAGAASILGTLTVWGLRGVTTRVEQTMVVDGHANSALAVATGLFGVKTPNHALLNVRLPIAGIGRDDEGAFGPLRALPADTSELGVGHGFVAPQTYACGAGGTVLDGLPVRATLKELEGAWEGVLGGRLEAQLVMSWFPVPDAAGVRIERFDEGTFIRNRLGFDLRNCFLLETPSETAVRPGLVRCYSLGDLPAEGPGSQEDARSLARLFIKPGGGPGGVEYLRPGDLRTLDHAIKSWSGAMLARLLPTGGEEYRGVVGRARLAESALLLLSTMDLYSAQSMHPARSAVVLQTHGRRLGCLHQLTRQTALLIGFSNAPPPATLQIDGEPVQGRRTWTMYRFVIPVERRGRPA